MQSEIANGFPWIVVVTLTLLASLLVGIALSGRVRAMLDKTDTEGGNEEGGNEEGDDSADDDRAGEDASRAFSGITAPIVGITSLLLSFSLFNVWTSFTLASEKANLEALAVDYQSDMAQLLPGKQAQELEAVLVCYARSIAGPEWQTMADYGERTDADVDAWTDRLQFAVGTLSDAPGGANAVAREFIAADRERGTARSQRLTQARVSVPEPITLLLLAATSTTIITLAFAHMPATNRRLHIAGLGVVTVMFIGVLGIIIELDSPYWGVLDIEPTDMMRVATDEAADYGERFPQVPLPCDESGRAV